MLRRKAPSQPLLLSLELVIALVASRFNFLHRSERFSENRRRTLFDAWKQPFVDSLAKVFPRLSIAWLVRVIHELRFQRDTPLISESLGWLPFITDRLLSVLALEMNPLHTKSVTRPIVHTADGFVMQKDHDLRRTAKKH